MHNPIDNYRSTDIGHVEYRFNYVVSIVDLMSDREPTRWQHNRIYPQPINPCVYTYDSICHLKNFI